MAQLLSVAAIIVLIFATCFCAGRDRRSLPLYYLHNSSVIHFIGGFGVPAQDLGYEAVTTGVVFKAQYNLPRSPANTRHINRLNVNAGRATRWRLYSSLEEILEHFGFVCGKACLLRSICEAATVPLHNSAGGLLAEVVHIILTPSSSYDGPNDHMAIDYLSAEVLGRSQIDLASCGILYKECPVSILDQYTHILDTTEAL